MTGRRRFVTATTTGALGTPQLWCSVPGNGYGYRNASEKVGHFQSASDKSRALCGRRLEHRPYGHPFQASEPRGICRQCTRRYAR